MLKSECRLLKGVGAFSTNKQEPKERKWKKMIIMILLLVILIILVLLFFKCCSNRGITPPPSDSTSTTTSEPEKTLDFIPAGEEGRITIPGYAGIYLKAGTNQQTVDFHNPETNDCYFKISLYLSNDFLLYESDLIKPGEHITNITINQKLQKGIYKNCLLVYQCYSLDSQKQLNGSTQNIEINSR